MVGTLWRKDLVDKKNWEVGHCSLGSPGFGLWDVVSLAGYLLKRAFGTNTCGKEGKQQDWVKGEAVQCRSKSSLGRNHGLLWSCSNLHSYLRWARGQLRNLALTGHWIWVIPWRGVTLGEVVLCSWGNSQRGLIAAGCLLTVLPPSKTGASPSLKVYLGHTSQCCHIGQIKSKLLESCTKYSHMNGLQNLVLKKTSDFLS